MPRDLPDDLEHDHISNYEVSDDYAEKYLRRPMPADVPVSLTPWFDAKDNPPGHEHHTLTSNGEGFHDPDEREWLWPADSDGDCLPMNPLPKWWTEVPSPPDMSDPLTVEDLRCLTEPPDAFSPTIGQRRYWQAAARLRRALEAAEKGAA